MNRTYYEYADDLLARRDDSAPGSLHEVWHPTTGTWELDYDGVRFAFTAQKIDDPEGFKSRNPQAVKAFATA